MLDRVEFRQIAIGIAVVTGRLRGSSTCCCTPATTTVAEKVPILDINTEQTLWATFQGSLIFSSPALDPDRPAARYARTR